MIEPLHYGLFTRIEDFVSEESARNYAEERAVELQIRYRTDWHTRYDFRAFGFTMHGNGCNPHSPFFCASQMEAVDTGGVHLDKMMVLAGYSDKYCGQASLGGKYGATYIKTPNCKDNTIAHEGGHLKKRKHERGLYPDGRIDPYSPHSTMGSVGFGWNVVDAVHLELLTDREILRFSDSRQVCVSPWELSHHALRAGEYDAAIVNGEIYLCMRKCLPGHPFHQNPSREQAVYIYTAPYNGLGSMYHVPLLFPGQSREIEGVTIHYLEYDDECARLAVVQEGDSMPADIPMPSGFPGEIPTIELNEHHSGIWHHPVFFGQGVVVQVENDTLMVYWFTFDTKGQKRFYYGGVPLGAGPEEFDLWTSEDGTFADPSKYHEERIGRARLVFTDQEHGVFHVNTEEHGRLSIELQPVARTEVPGPAVNGVWHDETRKGEGFVIHGFKVLNHQTAEIESRLTVYWFTYDSVGRQRWYLAVGGLHPNRPPAPGPQPPDEWDDFALTVYEATDTKIMLARDATMVERGTARIRFTGDAAVFEHTLFGAPGILNLTRWFG